MTRATLLGRLAEPATRLIGVAIAVGALVGIQVIVLILGGIFATREANSALDDSFTYLADVSEERVVAYADAAEQVAGETSRSLEAEDPGVAELVGTLHGAVTSQSQVEAVSVTYTDGTFAELSRSPFRGGGFSSHVITYDEYRIAIHQLTEYDVQMRLISTGPAPLRTDARSSGCYERASRAASAVWSDPEVNPITGRVAVRVCEAARTPEGVVFAVVSVSLGLEELGSLLNFLPAGSDGEVYLLSLDRHVIAAPPMRRSEWWDLATRMGNPPDAAQMGAVTDNPATAGSRDDVFGTDAGNRTVERSLGDERLQWIIHLRATELGVNEGFARLRTSLIVVDVGLVILTLGIGYLLSRMWRPLLMVRDVAERDPLTGLYNRHHVEARISRTIAAATRDDHQTAVVMLDLDNFKQLNDDLGHNAGDKALARVAEVLGEQTREGDIAVRWGGDEFLVVLRLKSAEEAPAVVERLRSRAEQALQEKFRDRAGLGVTAGFAVSAGWAGDIEAAIAAADAALIDGKWEKKGTTYGA